MWPERLFLPGVACFGVAHVLYTRGLGLEPVGDKSYVIFPAVAWVFTSVYVGKDVDEMILRGMTTLYGVLISVMVWRAHVRFATRGSGVSLAALIGAILFLVSDNAIAINKWKFAFPGSSTFIMLTYYLGQFGLAYSAIMSQTNHFSTTKAK